jgi:hypothetical protein
MRETGEMYEVNRREKGKRGPVRRETPFPFFPEVFINEK